MQVMMQQRRTIEQAKSKLGISMRRVSGWKENEVVFLAKKEVPTMFPMAINDTIMELKPMAKQIESKKNLTKQ